LGITYFNIHVLLQNETVHSLLVLLFYRGLYRVVVILHLLEQINEKLYIKKIFHFTATYAD